MPFFTAWGLCFVIRPSCFFPWRLTPHLGMGTTTAGSLGTEDSPPVSTSLPVACADVEGTDGDITQGGALVCAKAWQMVKLISLSTTMTSSNGSLNRSSLQSWDACSSSMFRRRSETWPIAP